MPPRKRISITIRKRRKSFFRPDGVSYHVGPGGRQQSVVHARNISLNLAKTHGPINDFIHAILKYLDDLTLQYGGTGTPMYDPLPWRSRSIRR